jgi:hypothetical protein
MPKSSTKLSNAVLVKETALARKRVLEADLLQGKVLNAADVRWAWSQAFVALRDRALGMSERIAQRGANRSAAELRVIVSAEIEDLLNAVSRGDLFRESAGG